MLFLLLIPFGILHVSFFCALFQTQTKASASLLELVLAWKARLALTCELVLSIYLSISPSCNEYWIPSLLTDKEDNLPELSETPIPSGISEIKLHYV